MVQSRSVTFSQHLTQANLDRFKQAFPDIITSVTIEEIQAYANSHKRQPRGADTASQPYQRDISISPCDWACAGLASSVITVVIPFIPTKFLTDREIVQELARMVGDIKSQLMEIARGIVGNAGGSPSARAALIFAIAKTLYRNGMLYKTVRLFFSRLSPMDGLLYGIAAVGAIVAEIGTDGAETVAYLLAVARDMLAIISSARNVYIECFSVTVTSVLVYGRPDSAPGNSLLELCAPEGLVIDDTGGLYISDAVNARVLYLARGAPVATIVAGGQGGPVGNAGNQLYTAGWLALSADSQLYVHDQRRITSWRGGNATVIVETTSHTAMAFDDAGDIYCCNVGANSVEKFSVASQRWSVVAGDNGAGSGPNQFNHPFACAFDSEGNLYVTDSQNHRVQKWAPGATSGTTVAGTGQPGAGADELNNPEILAMDVYDNLYVGDWNNRRVQKWAPGAGKGVTVAMRAQNDGAKNVLAPAGIAVDDDGNVFVSDAYNNQVRMWSIPF